MKRMVVLAAIVLLAVSTAAQASEAIKNWAAPSSWTPPSAKATGRSALVTYPPLPFIPLDPCRVIDTRLASFPAGYGPPSMAGGGTQRSFTITGQCGVPAGAQAVSFNFAVWVPPTRGDLRVFPAGGVTPTVSALNWEAGILALANAAVVPIGAGGAITVQIDGPGTVDIFVDINGYYGSNVGPTTFAVSSSSYFGVYSVSSTGIGVTGFGPAAGVAGVNAGGVGGFGVEGIGSSGIGVQGTSSSNVGVKGMSGNYNGVWAESASQDGLFASGGRDGAFIQGARFGVVGVTSSIVTGTSGVRGVNGSGEPPNCSDATHRQDGVRGCSQGDIGMTAIVGNTGFSAFRAIGKDAGGAIVTEAWLGYNPGTLYGVYANVGTIGCNGCTKTFVDPHPTDPAKTIHYVSLEGPEAGTYFRGTARTQGGEAVIQVPDHFRWVTDPEGITVQLTAVGASANIYVESEDLNQIVVRSSTDVTFHYLVQGIRPAHKNFQPVIDGREYVPLDDNGRMPEAWTPWAKRRLIENGTYNPDGSVNMKTAERLGWTKMWSSREKPAQESKSASAGQ